LVFVSVNQVLVRLWTRVPCQWPDASHRVSDVCLTPGGGHLRLILARRSMACLTG
jgi:hypothetical protein